MSALIVCTSVAHGNTRKIAEAMAPVLRADILTPPEVDVAHLSTFDVVGFGSGVFNLAFHRELVRFIESIPEEPRRKAFVFATGGLPEPRFRPYTRTLASLIEGKGFDVIDTFTCLAFDTWLPFKVVGGIRKGRPNARDLSAAHAFAESLRERVRTTP